MTYQLKVLTKDSGRPYIRLATEISLDRYNRFSTFDAKKPIMPAMGHCIPPRGAKSSLIQMICAELELAGCPLTVVSVPWNFLKGQLIDPGKIVNSFTYYAPEFSQEFYPDVLEKIKHHKWYQRTNKPAYFATTNALITVNKENFINGLKQKIEETGKRPCVILDEAHLFDVLNPNSGWGATVNEIIDSGAFVISMTGTPFSNDGRVIPGFTKVVISTKDGLRDKVEDKKLRKVDTDGVLYKTSNFREGTGEIFKLKPDGGVDVAWSEAFANDWLNKMNFYLTNNKITDNNTNQKMMVSEMAKNKLDIRNIVKDPVMMTDILSLAVQTLGTLHKQAFNYQCPRRPKMLVVTTYDLAKDGKENSNFHAREAKRILEEVLENPDIKDLFKYGMPNIDIATSVNPDGTPDEKSDEKFKNFIQGSTDILIVKAMGLVGLDVPECKVLADLSTYKEGPLKHQMVTRIGTKWGKKDGNKWERWAFDIKGTYVAPNHKYNIELKQYIADQDGLPTQSHNTMKETGEQVTEPFNPTLEDDKGLLVAPLDQLDVSTEANDLESINAAEVIILYALKNKYPEFSKYHDTDTIRLFRQGAIQLDPEEIKNAAETIGKVKVKDPIQERKELAGKFGTRANKIVSTYIPYNEENKERWLNALIELQNHAKHRCKVYRPVGEIEDTELLKCLNEALTEITPEFAVLVGQGKL